MANKKTVKRRRNKPKRNPVIAFEQRDFPKEIIKRLGAIVSISGRSPTQVLQDFVRIAEATLNALPDQIKTVGATGNFAEEDPPDIATVFTEVRANYDTKWLGENYTHRVWQYFGEAFALLLEATAPGLWGEPNSLNIAGISGPDILGYLFQTWANPPGAKKWNGQILTPFSVATLLAECTVGLNGEQEIHNRLKEALSHPENILGQAVLLAGLTIPNDESDAVQDYFFTRMIPAAMSHYSPLKIYEPTIGTGVLALAAAAALPAWAVKLVYNNKKVVNRIKKL